MTILDKLNETIKQFESINDDKPVKIMLLQGKVKAELNAITIDDTSDVNYELTVSNKLAAVLAITGDDASKYALTIKDKKLFNLFLSALFDSFYTLEKIVYK